MSLVLIISLCFSAVVFGGNVWWFYRASQPFNWKVAGLFTAAAFAAVWVMYFLTEYVGEL